MAKSAVAALALLSVGAVAQNATCDSTLPGNLYSMTTTLIDGTSLNLAAWTGNVTLVTNVASFWGETVSHYNGLNALMAKYGSLNPGLRVLAQPCNQFGGQEPGANSEILNTLKYVRPGGGFVPDFPLTQKINVNGIGIDPIWTYIRASCEAATDDVSDMTPAWIPVNRRDVQWNFETVAFKKDGTPYRRYATAVEPASIDADIQFLLGL